MKAAWCRKARSLQGAARENFFRAPVPARAKQGEETTAVRQRSQNWEID
jgi:hypothetical protein